jgi:ribonuclease P protein subunit RPR2
MARGKEKAVGINPKNVQAFDRLSFLHQASILMSTIQYESKNIPQSQHSDKNKKLIKKWKGDPPGTLLGPARYFNNNMKQITAKLVMRL